MDHAGVERWKTAFYEREGWYPGTGYPRRTTLEALDLRYVADLMERKGKLGS